MKRLLNMNTNLLRTKPINEISNQGNELHRVLTAFQLTLFGIGAIIGAGVFVLTGIAAATKAGPSIVLSYLLAAFACGFSALAYAELAAAIGGCGSAYGYAYAGLGEIIAWVIGWDLMLEYGVGVSAVAIGWSGYMNNMLTAAGIYIPEILTKCPSEGGLVNLPAILIIFVIMLLQITGIKQSARFNSIVVFIKLTAIAIFIWIAMHHVEPANWHPFMPFGWHGITAGAALIFFAYIGFDAVSTAAEETVNPQRDLPIAIIASLAICTVIYMVVSGLLTGIVSYETLNVSSPVSHALLAVGERWGAAVVAVGAVAGLTTVLLVMFYGLSRIILAMSRDGLLPKMFSVVHSKYKTPARSVLLLGTIIAVISGFAPMSGIAEVVNIGTLSAFVLVCAGVLVLRRTRPDMVRPFKVPFAPTTPILGIIFCVYLMFQLVLFTWAVFFIWMAIGLIIYFGYSRRNSQLEPPRPTSTPTI
jgi:APA family basic amino acid/polyamine antiporter